MYLNPRVRCFLALGLLFAFLGNGLALPPAHAQELFLPAPGVRISLSPAFNPPVLKGLKVHPDNPFRFDFILDVGDGPRAVPQDTGRAQGPAPTDLREESTKLIKYFLASLTVPEKDLWVNLSPYEKDPIAILLQYGFVRLTLNFYSEAVASKSPSFFLWSAFVEELIKFYAIKMTILNNPEFDEPIDAMIYMVTAGLGFAAIENILVTFQTFPDGANAVVSLLTLRFIGATLLHALSSALLGYFLAMAWFFQDHHKKLLIIGMIIATMFHFTFNMIIASFENQVNSLVYTTSLLLMMSFLVSILFDRMRNRHLSGTRYSA